MNPTTEGTDMDATITTTAGTAPILAGADAGADIRIVRDTATGAVAIVLSASAADSLDLYLDGLGTLPDVAGDDADAATLAAADVVLTIRALIRA